MSTVTVPQAQPGDELTDTLINRGPNAVALVVNGQLDDTNIASLSGSKITTGSIPSSASADSGNLELFRSENNIYGPLSGMIWSALTGLNASMTSGVFLTQTGSRVSISAIATRAFTASKDTYVSFGGTGTVAYQEVTNGALPPTLSAGYKFVSKVVTNGSTVTSITDLRGGPIPVNALNNPYKFGVFASTYVAPSATHTVQMSNKLYDTNNNFNTTTYMYTAPLNGYYFFSAGVQSGTNVGTGYLTSLFKNGSEILRGNSYISNYSNGAFNSTTASGLLQLAVGDTIAVVWTGVVGTGNFTITGGSPSTYLNGYLVSQT